MRVDRWWRGAAVVAVILLAASCGGDAATAPIDAPSELAAEAVGTRTVRLSWRPASATDVAGYEIQRRRDLQGAFATIAASVSPTAGSRSTYFDTDVEPNTYYGYRLRAVSRLGARSSMTNIAGTKTASSPGLLIRTSTVAPNAESADVDGYTAIIRGSRDTTSVALAVTGERLVPLGRGTYSVVLRGMALNCATTTAADTMKTATVTDEGTQTVADMSFVVSCRDPKKASVVVVHSTSGDTLDADGLALTVSGIIREAGTPADERVYFQSRKLDGRSGATRFDNLRLGDYEIAISDVDPPCTLDGERVKTLQPKALAVDTVRFAVTCRKPIVPVDTVGRPYVLHQKWSTSSARPGDKVSVLTSIDLRSPPPGQVLSVSANMQFDNAVVKYDSARSAASFDITSVSHPQPNLVALAATNTTGQGLSGDIQIVRFWFTVVGASGSSVRTGTTVTEVLTPTLANITSKIRPEDATLTVSNVAPANQPPTAKISAPATGTVGTSVTFSGSQSTDADGSIASYAWTFGDNATGTGSSATHTYSSAGTYTVRLIVTDDRGATGFVEQPIVVTAATASTGTISGTVTSPQRAALSGVTVTVDGGGGTATTNASGLYTIANVPTGSKSVTLSTLPTGCTAPAAQTATVSANATATINFTVTCTATATTGTVIGKVTRASDNSGIANAQVLVQAADASTPVTATTGSDGTYSAPNVPLGSGATAGMGSITLQQLPSGCTNPGSQSYSGLAAGETLTKNIAVTCTSGSQTGTVSGTITKSTGGAASGVQVTLSPAGGTALPAVMTNAQGAYSVSNVPVGTGGSIALSALPSGCTSASQSYGAVTAGGTVTKDITLTCTAGAFTYPLTLTWGAITNTGSTGRQVTLEIGIDMGAAPGRPDVAGANADPLASLSLSVAYNGTALDYQLRTALSPDEFDLVSANEINQGAANAQTAVAIASTSGATKTGAFQLVRMTFAIAAGFHGAVTPTVAVSEALATNNLVNVTSTVAVVTPPTLTVP